MKMSAEVKDLFEAFSQFQAEVKDVVRDCQSHKGKYAKLEQIVQSRELLSRFGLSFTQMIGDCSKDYVEIENIVMHKSGQYFSKIMKVSIGSVPVGKDGRQSVSVIQHIGSGISYARRYGLLSLFGMAQEDNDGALPDGSTQNGNRYFNGNQSQHHSSDASFYASQKKDNSAAYLKLNRLIEVHMIPEEKVNEWKSYFKVRELNDMSVDQLNSIVKKVESHYSTASPSDNVIPKEVVDNLLRVESEIIKRLESAGTVN